MPETYAEQQVKVLMEELAAAQEKIKRLQNRLELEQIYLERTVSRLDWWQNRHVNYVAEIAEILKRMQA